MKTFEIKYEYTGYNNELRGILVDGKLYGLEKLSEASKDLLTAMSYEDYENSLEYFDGIAQMIGYDITLQGILDLTELGVNIASGGVYRLLVMNSFKNKYKGMWR